MQGISLNIDPDIEKIENAIVCFSKPKTFTGAGSAEIAFDRNFETLCLSLSEQLHIQPKGMTVLEFYNAFAYLEERAKAARKAQKRP